MSRRAFLTSLLFFPILSWWITPPKPQELQLAASGNIREVLTEVARFVESRNPMTKIKLFFGSAKEVVRQIQSHATFDVYIGDEDDMDTLQDEDLLVDQPIQLIQDQMLAVVPGDSDLNITDIKQLTPQNVQKIALTHEDTPLGSAARDYLDKYGLLDALEQDKITDVKSPHGAIEAIKRGEAKWTLVMSSEAARRKNLKILWRVPFTDVPAQTFSVARLTCSRNQEFGTRIIAGLRTSIVRRMFDNAGYLLLTPQPDNRDPKKN